jgi:hypothetical protein
MLRIAILFYFSVNCAGAMGPEAGKFLVNPRTDEVCHGFPPLLSFY